MEVRPIRTEADHEEVLSGLEAGSHRGRGSSLAGANRTCLSAAVRGHTHGPDHHQQAFRVAASQPGGLPGTQVE